MAKDKTKTKKPEGRELDRVTLQLIPAPTAKPAARVEMTPQASGRVKLYNFVWDYL